MDSSSSTPETLTLARPTDFRVCNDDEEDALSEPWGVAPIDFTYSVDTSISLVSLTSTERDAVLSSLSAAIVESIYEYGCAPQLGRKRWRSLSSPGSVSRRAEILSISPGIGHELMGECDDQSFAFNTANESFCNEIRGTVVIAFDRTKDQSTIAATDFKSVGKSVLSRIEEDMMNENFIDAVNDDLQSSGVTVNSMKYIDSDYLDLVSQNAFTPLDWSNDDGVEVEPVGGLTRFAKVAIPFMVILSLVAVVLCWLAAKASPKDSFFAKLLRWRDRREEKKLKQLRMKESKAALALEATLQDLKEAEAKKHARSYGVVTDNAARSGVSLFSTRSRPQSTAPISDGSFHPSDTETGSCGRSVEGSPSPEMNIAPKAAETQTADANLRTKDTPIRALTAFFNGQNAIGSVLPAPSLMERINSCSVPQNCLANGTNENPKNGTVMQYIVPGVGVERTNSLIDESESPLPGFTRSSTAPDLARSSTLQIVNTASPSMGRKKAAAYKEYINRKMFQRNAHLHQEQYNQQDEVEEVENKPDDQSEMEIGVKRTFTDSQGTVREMIAL